MDENMLWNEFKNSGKIEDYLKYKGSENYEEKDTKTNKINLKEE